MRPRFQGGPRNGEPIDLMEDGTLPDELVVLEQIRETLEDGSLLTTTRNHVYRPDAFGRYAYRGLTSEPTRIKTSPEARQLPADTGRHDA